MCVDSVIKSIKEIPDTDMEGTRFDEGDIAYYDANADGANCRKTYSTSKDG